MKNIQNLTIDINKKPFQTITANKGEVGSRFIRITIVDNSTPVDLTGVTVSLYAKKPDGKKVFNSVTVEDKANGVVLAELTSQILSVSGLVRLTLLLVKNGSKLASKQFLVNVDESIVDDEAIESTNEFTALVDALGRVNNIDSRFEKVNSQLEHIADEIENKTDINDDSISTKSVWSSSKTQTMIQQIPKGDKGDKGEPGTASVAIDDTTTNTSQTWSSNHIANKIDSNLIRFNNTNWITTALFDTITATTSREIWLVYQFDISNYSFNATEDVECNFNVYTTDTNVKQIKCSLYTNNNATPGVIVGGEVKTGQTIDISKEFTQYNFKTTNISTTNKYFKVLVGVVLNDTTKPFTININDVNIKISSTKLTTHTDVIAYNNSAITDIRRNVKLENQLITVKDIDNLGLNSTFTNMLDVKIEEKTSSTKTYEVFDINTYDTNESYLVYSFDVSGLSAGFINVEFDIEDLLGNLNGVGTSIYMNNDDSVEILTGGASYTTKDIVSLIDKKCKYRKTKNFNLNTSYKYLKIVILPQKTDSEKYVKCKVKNIKITVGMQKLTKLVGVGAYRYSNKIINTLVDDNQIVNYKLLTTELNKGVKSQWENKKWLVIGDSITDKTSHATLNYYDYIAENIGCNIVNNGKNGSGYLTSFATNVSLLDRISTLPTDVDLVTVFLGTNDFGANKPLGEFGASDTTTFYGAVNKCINDLITKYVDKKIAVFTPLRRINDIVNNTENLKLNDYRKAILDVCEYYSIPVLDLYKCSGISIYNPASKTLLTTDGLHPNDIGHKKISNIIQSFINNL